jgi:hypothetical protein
MKTAIELDQFAKVRFPGAPLPVRRRFPRAAPQPFGQHPAAHRVDGDHFAVFTGQMFGRQRRPEPHADRAAVLRANQGDDPTALRLGIRAVRAAAHAAMAQPFGPLRPIAAHQPLRLPVPDP